MKNKILYSLILLGYIMTGCNEPENNGFSVVNLESNTNLNIETTYVSGTDVYIKDLYNGSELNYTLSNIQNHSIYVNNLKYNLNITPSNSSSKCFIYNGMRYFGDIIPDPLLYCEDKSNFVQSFALFNNYKFNFNSTSDVYLPLNPDSFDGFYVEHGLENQIALVAMPVVMTTSLNDAIPKYISFIRNNEIIETISDGIPNTVGTSIISEMTVTTKMEIGAMSLLNIITKEIKNGDNASFPNTFLTSSNGRVSKNFTIQINIKVTINENSDPIGYNLVLGVFANKETSNTVEFEAENNLLNEWRDFISPFNISQNP